VSTDTFERVLTHVASPAASPPVSEPAAPAAPFPPAAVPPVRVLIIAENASYRFGGEAVLPLHYFRLLRSRGIPVWMITNQRCEAELAAHLPPEDMKLLHFVPDGPMHRRLGPLSKYMPSSLFSFTIGQMIEIVDQLRARKLARRLITEHAITIVHQPIPVSPKHVSVLTGLPVPVVMGPMNGGVSFPPAFRHREPLADRIFVPIGRAFAGVINRLLPGKLRAATLMVANDRTAEALPRGVRGKIEHVVENGIHLDFYRSHAAQSSAPAAAATAPSVRSPKIEVAIDHAAPALPAAPTRFVFIGRLIDLKGVDLLLEAVKIARAQVPLHLDILGDGPCRAAWTALAERLGINGQVTFHGWKNHQACAEVLAGSNCLVLPSLRECGGAVVLEAMAMRLPVIATRWGGPADYIDAPDSGRPATGILVTPESPRQFIADLAGAMVHLARHPDVRAAMGTAGYTKIISDFDWERKLDRVLAIYRDTLRRHAPAQVPAAATAAAVA
jgi:glycosyltransferase involved in cell wall biosynthesis